MPCLIRHWTPRRAPNRVFASKHFKPLSSAPSAEAKAESSCASGNRNRDDHSGTPSLAGHAFRSEPADGFKHATTAGSATADAITARHSLGEGDVSEGLFTPPVRASDVAATEEPVLVGEQPLDTHRSARVDAIGRDAHLCSEAVAVRVEVRLRVSLRVPGRVWVWVWSYGAIVM